MAHSHSKHNKFAASHRRAAQFMHENRGGTCAPKKRFGGAAGMVPKSQHQDAVDEDISAEGRGSKRRYAKGGKVRHQVNIVVVGHHPPQTPAQMGAPVPPPGIPMGPGALPPAGPAAGLMPPGIAPGQPPMRADDGRLPHGGAFSGVGRLGMYEKMKREGN
jgi:hypothetical protein